MGKAIEVKGEHSALDLRNLARRCLNPRQASRMLAIAAVLDGFTREQAAKAGGMDRQSLRDWVHRYNAEGINGLKDRDRPHPSPLRTFCDAQEKELCALVEAGPDLEKDGVVRWRLKDLQAWVLDKWSIKCSPDTISVVLKKHGFTRLSQRPQAHDQDPQALADFKKTSPPQWTKSRRV